MASIPSRFLLLSLACVSALPSGCASVPTLGPRAEMQSPSSLEADRVLAASEMTAGTWPEPQWWSAYGDRQLDALIREALAGSPDLAAAAARLRAAEGYFQEAQGRLLPSMDLEGGVYELKQSRNIGIPAEFVPRGWSKSGALSGQGSLDIDLWGRNRAATAAALSEIEAAALELQEARLTLSTGIAIAYADLDRQLDRRGVQEEALRIRLETGKLVTARVSAGLDTRAQQRMADAAVSVARLELAVTEEAIALTRNRIAALLGKGPDRGLMITPPNMAMPERGLPENVTIDLIGRRPDIAAARARVEAAARRIKVARADFYPSISLKALVGVQSLGLDLLFKSASVYGQVGPAIRLPLFHGGELAGRYRGARGAYDAAVADYDRSLIEAIRQVADAVTSRQKLAAQLAEARRALASSEEARQVARLRYEGGLSPYLDALTAEDRALENRRRVVDLEARALALDVVLVRALGGGFVDTPSSVARPGAEPERDRHG